MEFTINQKDYQELRLAGYTDIQIKKWVQMMNRRCNKYFYWKIEKAAIKQGINIVRRS